MSDNQVILRFTPYAWAKLIHMRDAGDTEIGGFGIAEGPDDPLLITDFTTLRQECDAAYTEFDDDAVADFFDEMVDRGLQPRQFARVWIHTHPGHSASPSQTDEQTFRDVFTDPDWAVMFILARGGQITCRLQMTGVVTMTDSIPVALAWDVPFRASDAEGWEKEYEANVRGKKTGSVIVPIGGGEEGDRQPDQHLEAGGDLQGHLENGEGGGRWWNEGWDHEEELWERTRSDLMDRYFAARELGDEAEAEAVAQRIEALAERDAAWDRYVQQEQLAVEAASVDV